MWHGSPAVPSCHRPSGLLCLRPVHICLTQAQSPPAATVSLGALRFGTVAAICLCKEPGPWTGSRPRRPLTSMTRPARPQPVQATAWPGAASPAPRVQCLWTPGLHAVPPARDALRPPAEKVRRYPRLCSSHTGRRFTLCPCVLAGPTPVQSRLLVGVLDGALVCSHVASTALGSVFAPNRRPQ